MEVQRAQEARPAGPLQRLLQEGEFGLLSHTLILESNFFQVGRHGEVLNVSKRVQEVTMGVAETGPATGVPNVILMAVPAAPPAEGMRCCRGGGGARHLPWVLTGFPHRLLPLQCVKLAVYGRLQHCLRLRFPTGRKVYLQLCPGPRAEELFLHWAALVTVLPVPGEPSIHPTPAGEPVPGGEACSTGVTQPEGGATQETENDSPPLKPTEWDETVAAHAGGLRRGGAGCT
uniref:Golgi associated RAB2 interactor protein-like Rab2B-binding domain-containing protein n=1 Tax=Gallus gallus TaxID=9031 RepID=A0A8V0XSL3_CHICK